MSYDDVIKAVFSGFSQFQWYDLVDILLISFLLYKLIIWTKETQAYQVLKGIAVLFLCSVASQLLQLNTLSWLLDSFLKSGTIIMVIVILFQPEIRRMLERLGRSGKKLGSLFETTTVESESLVRDVQRAVLSLSRRRVGMLVVIEQRTALGDIINTGTRLDAVISGALIENIFEPNTPLHDGAAIIRSGRIQAAGCMLPLSNNPNLSKELGMRHRAGIGMSEASDAVVVIVSEETGAISVAVNGMLKRHLTKDTFEKILLNELIPEVNEERTGALRFLRRKEKDKADE